MVTFDLRNCWILLNKPQGITSNQAGTRVKRYFKATSLGHGGTLDPFATGLLPLALGEATKTMPYVLHDTKEYIFNLTFGEERDSGDTEGHVMARTSLIPSAQDIDKNISQFLGPITQIPPIYSALKIQGIRACDRARRGETVEMKPRTVLIYQLKLCSQINATTFQLQVSCGPGTYIRSLGQDLARSCGSYGYLSALKRTKVGKFDLLNAIELDTLLNEDPYSLKEKGCVLSIRDVLDGIPALPVTEEQSVRIRQGQRLKEVTSSYQAGQKILLILDDIPLALAVYEDGFVYPKRLFHL